MREIKCRGKVTQYNKMSHRLDNKFKEENLMVKSNAHLLYYLLWVVVWDSVQNVFCKKPSFICIKHFAATISRFFFLYASLFSDLHCSDWILISLSNRWLSWFPSILASLVWKTVCCSPTNLHNFPNTLICKSFLSPKS